MKIQWYLKFSGIYWERLTKEDSLPTVVIMNGMTICLVEQNNNNIVIVISWLPERYRLKILREPNWFI